MARKYAFSFPFHVVGIGTEGLNLNAIFADDVVQSPYWFVPEAARFDEVDSDIDTIYVD